MIWRNGNCRLPPHTQNIGGNIVDLPIIEHEIGHGLVRCAQRHANSERRQPLRAAIVTNSGAVPGRGAAVGAASRSTAWHSAQIVRAVARPARASPCTWASALAPTASKTPSTAADRNLMACSNRYAIFPIGAEAILIDVNEARPQQPREKQKKPRALSRPGLFFNCDGGIKIRS